MATYTFIASTTLTSTTSTISFTSIPQTYTDLVILITARQNTYNYGGFFTKLNNSTLNSDVVAIRLAQDAGTPFSNASKEITWDGGNGSFTTNTFASNEAYFFNYTSSNYKCASFSAAQETNGSGGTQHFTAWQWSQTAAITQIDFGTFDGGFVDAFVAGSTAYIYGISKA
jgi:hypothetical protein